MNNEHDVRNSVMAAIQKGSVRMRPKWHFLLLSLFGIVSGLLVFFALLYFTSLVVFLLRESGAWYAPSFGFRGWLTLLHALPWLLISLIIVFLVLLEIIVQRYAFVYRKPLMTSALALLIVVALAGMLLGYTSLQRQFAISVRHGEPPAPLGMWYHDSVLMSHPPDMYRGVIISTTTQGFRVLDPNDPDMFEVIITPETRLPYGANFERGTVVIVVGDAIGTGTIRAFGIRELDRMRMKDAQ